MGIYHKVTPTAHTGSRPRNGLPLKLICLGDFISYGPAPCLFVSCSDWLLLPATWRFPRLLPCLLQPPASAGYMSLWFIARPCLAQQLCPHFLLPPRLLQPSARARQVFLSCGTLLPARQLPVVVAGSNGLLHMSSFLLPPPLFCLCSPASTSSRWEPPIHLLVIATDPEW